jgi:hypothetical protein
VFRLTLRRLRQIVDPQISSFDFRLIKTSASPSMVYRVALDYPQGHPGVRSVIVKTIAPVWPKDPCGPDREVNFYSRLAPCLALRRPQVYYAGVDAGSQYRLIVMEDLSASHHFPSPTHRWTPDEGGCMMRAYARLHVQGRDCLPPEEQRIWMWQMALQEKPWEPEVLLRMVGYLMAQGIWASLPRIERLIQRTLAELTVFARNPATLLHNDVYPPNVALPLDLDGDAVLLDWEMAGWGLAECDLAFMFLQPYRSAREIDRTRALAIYWAERRSLEGRCPPVAERQAVQRHADAMWALSLVPVAYQAAAEPYPAGSAPRAYWNAMFGVLYEHLANLCAET